jgi:hypothetical protein
MSPPPTDESPGGYEARPFQAGKLQLVRVHRRIPFVRQILERAHVIKVAVNHDDCDRARIGAEAGGSRILDQALGPGQACVDQYPAPVSRLGRPVEHDIDDPKVPIGDVGHHLVGLVVPGRVERRVERAGIRGQCDLLGHGFARREIKEEAARWQRQCDPMVPGRYSMPTTRNSVVRSPTATARSSPVLAPMNGLASGAA